MTDFTWPISDALAAAALVIAAIDGSGDSVTDYLTVNMANDEEARISEAAAILTAEGQALFAAGISVNAAAIDSAMGLPAGTTATIQQAANPEALQRRRAARAQLREVRKATP